MDDKTHRMTDLFGRIAQATSQRLGHPVSFMLAALVVVVWGVSGPIFKYSNTWQLVINTGTTIVTFLMVFLIQNTQNRDMAALHLKLAELIRVNGDARDKLLNIEDMTEEELQQLKGSFATIASNAAAHVEISGVKLDISPAPPETPADA